MYHIILSGTGPRYVAFIGSMSYLFKKFPDLTEKKEVVIEQADKVKAGFVYVGPVADAGWTYEHDRGRLAVDKAYGEKVETIFVESVAEGPDAERVISQIAADGADIILTRLSLLQFGHKVFGLSLNF